MSNNPLKTICRTCQVQYKIEKNGAPVIEMFQDPPQPYKIWQADLLRCPGCGHWIATGFGDGPIGEHFQDDFAKILAKAEAHPLVTYSYEHQHSVGNITNKANVRLRR